MCTIFSSILQYVYVYNFSSIQYMCTIFSSVLQYTCTIFSSMLQYTYMYNFSRITIGSGIDDLTSESSTSDSAGIQMVCRI